MIPVSLHELMSRPGTSLVQLIIFSPNTQSQSQIIQSQGDYLLVYTIIMHGDHDDDWVFLFNGDVEVERYNAKYLELIKWKRE